MLNIGCHLSTSKGFKNMGKEALSIGANTFQFFTRNPRGGKAKDIDAKDVNELLEIMKKNNLSYEQMAQSAAIATAFIIQQSNNISPEEGFETAIYHYIEGSKTYPPEFGFTSKTEPKEQNEKKSENQAKP